jgi:hypothetical protein
MAESARPAAAILLSAKVPEEINKIIIKKYAPVARGPFASYPVRNPSIAPSDGSCPFLDLPCEMRREIFSYLLPGRGKVVEPCQVYPKEAPEVSAPARTGRMSLARWKRETAAAAKKFAESTMRVGDALVLNKHIASEILVMLYEERTFAINIYEGVLDGGVEFLNSGVQRLQFRDQFTQVRFKRFESPNDPFGFSRIKKVMINIYPANKVSAAVKNSRHNAMHTHFMLRAIVKLLQKDSDPDLPLYLQDGNQAALHRLHIRFVEPDSEEYSKNPWSTTGGTPRPSSIHGISHMELILRGLLDLCNVHTVVVAASHAQFQDQQLSDFVDRFQSVVTGKQARTTVDENLHVKIECAKDLLDDWIQQTLFASKASKAIKAALSDTDFDDVQEADQVSYSYDDEDYLEVRTLPTGGADHDQATQDEARRKTALRDDYEERITKAKEDEPVIEPVVEPFVEPFVEPVVQPVVQPVVEPVIEPKRGRIIESPVHPAVAKNRNKVTKRRSPYSLARQQSSGGATLLSMVSLDDVASQPDIALLPARPASTRPLSRRATANPYSTDNLYCRALAQSQATQSDEPTVQTAGQEITITGVSNDNNAAAAAAPETSSTVPSTKSIISRAALLKNFSPIDTIFDDDATPSARETAMATASAIVPATLAPSTARMAAYFLRKADEKDQRNPITGVQARAALLSYDRASRMQAHADY